MRFHVVLVGLLLAGCGQPAPQTAAECTEGECLAVVDEDVPGAIRGVVVDATITPVAGANVCLLAGGGVVAQAISSDAGAFSFRGLAPGLYFVRAAMAGFETSQAQADVTQGDQASIRIVMPRTASPPMLATTFAWEGLMGCSVRIPLAWAQFCSTLDDQVGPPFSDDSFVFYYDELVAMQQNPAHLQIEVAWESTQALGDAMTLFTDVMSHDRRRGGILDITDAPSPIIVRLDGNVMREHHLGHGNGEPARGIALQLWAGMGDGVVGVTYQQTFQAFTTPFYGFVPDADWTFVTHGEPQP